MALTRRAAYAGVLCTTQHVTSASGAPVRRPGLDESSAIQATTSSPSTVAPWNSNSRVSAFISAPSSSSAPLFRPFFTASISAKLGVWPEARMPFQTAGAASERSGGSSPYTRTLRSLAACLSAATTATKRASRRGGSAGTGSVLAPGSSVVAVGAEERCTTVHEPSPTPGPPSNDVTRRDVTREIPGRRASPFATAFMDGVPTQRSFVSETSSRTNVPVVASSVPNTPVHSATRPSARQSSTMARNAGSFAAKYCAPWSNCHPAPSGPARRVEVRPPGPLPVSYTVTAHPPRARCDAAVSPEIPAPTTATRGGVPPDVSEASREDAMAT